MSWKKAYMCVLNLVYFSTFQLLHLAEQFKVLLSSIILLIIEFENRT